MNYLKALAILAFFVGVTFPADALAPAPLLVGHSPVEVKAAVTRNKAYTYGNMAHFVIVREI